MKKGFSTLAVYIGIIVCLAVILLLAAFTPKTHACGEWFGNACSSNANQLNTLANNQAKLVTATPIPQLSNSLERANISRRATLFDAPNKISYIYLISYGKVMAFYTVKGKVTSLNSYMTPQEQIVDGDGNKCYGSASGCVTVQAPDVDGSYGTNSDGVFFFTTEGAYVEWKGDYMMSDEALKLSTTPELVRNIK